MQLSATIYVQLLQLSTTRLSTTTGEVTSGVPQLRLRLGPLLFLLFINDLPACINSTCHLFADNCLLYRQINTSHDADIVQQELYRLDQWADRWLMEFT